MTDSVSVVDLIKDRNGAVRWAVMATFAGAAGGQARCIEYRVRVVPVVPEQGPDNPDNWGNGSLIADELQADNERERIFVWDEAESEGPAEGIPRWVFEAASQARLLERARIMAAEQPERFKAATRGLLARDSHPRRGRPPARDLATKLRILKDVETAYRTGGTLAEVAESHHMSRSAVRDLLAWARSSDSGAVLFTGGGPGRKSGGLTPHARRLLEGME